MRLAFGALIAGSLFLLSDISESPTSERVRTTRVGQLGVCHFESESDVSHSVIEHVSGQASTPRGRVLSGSAIMLAGLGLVTLINFSYNIALARFLGPIAFGHTTAVYTLLILISAVTLSFQILTAKIVAQLESPEAQSLAYRNFHRHGWAASFFVSLLLLFFRQAVTAYLNLPDSFLIVLLAIGTMFYVPLGARRGYIQGVCAFRQLALNLVLEGLVRLFGSLLLIEFGYGVPGVIAANSAAVMTAYFFAAPKVHSLGDLRPDIPVAFREGLQAAVFFAGQVIINNCDIVVVKHFFPPESAGIYAAVALVGRVVFAFSWAIVSSMFPIAAEAGSRRQEDRGLLGTSLLMVLGICIVFASVLRLAPSAIWTHLFGSQFGSAAGSHFRYLLVLYAVSTGVYGLCVVLIAYEMSRRIANTGWVQLVFSSAVVAGIYLFHNSLAQVIWVQIVVMALLLLVVAIPFLATLFSPDDRAGMPGFVRLRRQLDEDEVIAEFLKNDFRTAEFARYHGVLDKLVTQPDFKDHSENQVRRALLNVRHGALWRELPKDTEWFEAEIQAQDLPRLRVFPRAQWRKLALGDFGIARVAERVLDDRYRECASEEFREKIDDLRGHLQQGSVAQAVLLIGQSESGPFTILDGNHRLVATMLVSPALVGQFRFFCGLSRRMNQCCWYQTSVWTLLRYGTNMVRYFIHDPEQELARVLQRSTGLSVRAQS